MTSRPASAEPPVARRVLKSSSELVGPCAWDCRHPSVSTGKVGIVSQMPHDHVVRPLQVDAEDFAEHYHPLSGAKDHRILRPWGVSLDDVQQTVSEQNLNWPLPRTRPDDTKRKMPMCLPIFCTWRA